MEAAAAAKANGEACLKYYQLLAAEALQEERAAYKVRPKLHAMAHLFMNLPATRENPRRQDVFGAEDFIGRIKKVANKCHRSQAHVRVIQRMFFFVPPLA